ncbi:pyridoxal phosphate-dependent aminotransferase [Candidatus Borkfalkia ceftriaxoniphila]|mgnify:CR=1 FL=1|uniref:Aminotransferase n=1 Tax=Candidatus Borkfalkia ceftriaxoniphila TaxID=2508949 RepID=A0A4V1QV28_9FIRM|nr:pyridoxal phosphate-dependent aminotransferase [Candidatus Borkfalkia ceftriaxoniphila]RXZ61206.1 pyridoxal phosphate-dependent aminotransferase [Candidatus Borkfalkia ceftriaxoniphila]
MNQRMYQLGSKRSVIREIFEFGKTRAQEIGAENVYDFSLGNPSVEPPACVKDTLLKLIEEPDQTALHGYTSAQGDLFVRRAIASHIRGNYDENADENYIYMTVGAAASLTITLSALCEEGDEVVTFAPYFTEYKVFAETAGARLVAVESDPDTFQIDFEKLEAVLGKNTRAVLVNSPNNPSGVVYNRETVARLAETLEKASEKFGHTIYLVSDEPYRELVYGGVEVPYITKFYTPSIVCYSYSKSLSLPGERIGYIYVNPKTEGAKELYLAVCGAGRALGYVCAPSLFQKLVARCVGKTSDVSVYRKNRDTLLNHLTKCGFSCVRPDGAFYLFMKTPEPDASAFCERAKKYDLLLVPGDDFGCKGYVRIAYCVSPDMIARALPAFEKLAKEYSL